MSKLAYICAPNSSTADVERAIEYSLDCRENGYIPIAPHIILPEYTRKEKPADIPLLNDHRRALLRRCDLLLICGDFITSSMRREINTAQELHIPIYARYLDDKED